MNHRLSFLLATFNLSTIVNFALAALRRPHRLFFLLAAFSISASAQNSSTFLDPSRATNWSSAGFTIPTYTTACPTQPTLLTGSSNAAANTTAIQNALASCTSTKNVVNLPAGTYYVAGWAYPQGFEVVRGAGPNSTYIYVTADASNCSIWGEVICMGNNSNGIYWGSGSVAPGSGSNQCAWTAGYAQGTTTITLSSCGSAPPSNTVLMLDQQNDTSDTGGIYICDASTSGTACSYGGNGESSGTYGNNGDGRCSPAANCFQGGVSGGITRSQIQSVWVTSVTSEGGGTYSVTISPGVYFNNIRSSQSPGAWWAGVYQNDGLENLTIDQTNAPSEGSDIGMFNCYQCWIKNIRSLYGSENHINTYQSLQGVIRDSYFYQSQTPGTTQSYGIQVETGTSGLLVENNIFQQLTAPIMFGQGTGDVIGYNVMLDNQEGGANMGFPAYAHNAGNEFDLWEGNSTNGINSDSSTWGSSANGTFFRNQILGWQLGKSQYTYAVSLESWSRAFNIVGNVLGQPGYQNTYQSYATSTTGGVNGGDQADTSIYALGWTGISGWGGCGSPPVCGPLVYTTLMRWGNYDMVNAATQWNTTEASPAAVAYVNANFTSSYFSTLAKTLPTSLYYGSTPSWWPSGKAWPPVGPDVSSGNVGVCASGTYQGAQATSSSQCGTGVSLTVSWACHVTSIPAQDCYLKTMGGPPDGVGSVLSFDASIC